MMTEYRKWLDRQLEALHALPAGGDVLDQVFRNPELKRAGTWVELGVAGGETLTRIARERGDARVWGFDSFQGLPEDWRPEFRRGHFKQKDVPRVDGACIAVGPFEETLPFFRAGVISFLHVDCDLYSSTRVGLQKLSHYFMLGTIIVFDEFWNYPGFEHHEAKALYEWCDGKEGAYRWIHVYGGEDRYPNERAALILE